MYLGTTSMSRLFVFITTYSMAMQIAEKSDEHNILPKGFNDYVAMKYLGYTSTPLGWHQLILEKEPDDKKALQIFFELLNEYLVNLGYEKIPELNLNKQ